MHFDQRVVLLLVATPLQPVLLDVLKQCLGFFDEYATQLVLKAVRLIQVGMLVSGGTVHAQRP